MPGLGLALGGLAINQIGSFLSARRAKTQARAHRRRQARAASGITNQMGQDLYRQINSQNPFQQASQFLGSQLGGTMAAQRQNIGQQTAGMGGRRAASIQNIGERGIQREVATLAGGLGLQFQGEQRKTLAGLAGMDLNAQQSRAGIISGGNMAAYQGMSAADPWTSSQEIGGIALGTGLGMMRTESMLNNENYKDYLTGKKP